MSSTLSSLGSLQRSADALFATVNESDSPSAEDLSKLHAALSLWHAALHQTAEDRLRAAVRLVERRVRFKQVSDVLVREIVVFDQRLSLASAMLASWLAEACAKARRSVRGGGSLATPHCTLTLQMQ